MTSPENTYVPALGFERLTGLYDPVIALTIRERRFKARLLGQVDLRPGDRVLDLGCGTGTLALAAKRAEPRTEVSGLDGDPAVLRRARAKAEGAGLSLSFDEAMADRMPYPDASFDKVVSTLFFHHLDRATKERVTGEIVRVLRPGGELHVADWGPARGLLGPVLFLPIRLLDGFEATADNATGRLHGVFEAAGLLDVRTRGRLQTALGTLAFLSARTAGPGRRQSCSASRHR